MRKFNYLLMLLLCLLLAACSTTEPVSTGSEVAEGEVHSDDEDHGDEDHDDHDHSNEGGDLMLPEFSAVALDGRALKVVATTSIVGDVVSNVGGDAIELTVLMGAGADPHSYESTPQDLVAMEEADVIFVNGWDLEEQVAETIEENFADKMVAISAGVEPLDFGGHSDHGDEHGDEHGEDEHGHNHSGADPHVWFEIHNVEKWAENTAEVLGELDTANADAYQANLSAYAEQLEALEGEVEALLEGLPSENRKLVTNHDALGYFAKEYGFEVVGTVLPSVSTSSDPSAGELAELIELMEAEGVCAIFGETTASNDLAETVAGELSDCDTVQVLTIFTGAIGEGDAGSYIGMFRANVETIVTGLQ